MKEEELVDEQLARTVQQDYNRLKQLNRRLEGRAAGTAFSWPGPADAAVRSHVARQNFGSAPTVMQFSGLLL